MAALAMQAKKPIALFQPMDTDVLKALVTGDQEAICYGQSAGAGNEKVDYFIGAKKLAIACSQCWKYTKENGMDVAKLIGASCLDVKGDINLQSEPGKQYSASFIVQRISGAKTLKNIKLTLEIDGKPVKERVVDLTEMAEDTWVALNVGDFKAAGKETKLKASLANHEDVCKSGLKIFGLCVQDA